MNRLLEYSPHDTWFFRESRPHNAVGAQELGSLFPPPPRTLAGALRTRIGDAANADWRAFASQTDHPLRARIGFANDPGPLRFTGPFVCKQGHPLFPAPANLLRTPDGQITRLSLGPATRCDLAPGRVRLPTLATPVEGAKELEYVWLTHGGFQSYLNGGVPAADSVLGREDLYAEEPRLGIAMLTAQRAAAQGKLYQTRHLRLAPDVSLRLAVAGLDEQAEQALPATVRLGGEGRLAGLAVVDGTLPAVDVGDCSNAKGLILTTLTPARPGEINSLPPGFQTKTEQDHTVWCGRLAGVALTIHGAACHKPLRVGGWNMAGQDRGPAPVQSFMPAGMVWYCTPDELSCTEAARQLHAKPLNPDDPWGHGLLACGVWPDAENLGDNK